MKKLAIGADIGGSHITCQIFDIENNVSIENSKLRIHVDSHGSKNEIIESWAEAIKKTAKTVGLNNLAGIGFAMPALSIIQTGLHGSMPKFRNLKTCMESISKPSFSKK